MRGRVHKYGDNINTDLISPPQYMELSYEQMAAHAMEGLDPGFVAKLRRGDILVAGKNFGSGSSRETAPIALQRAGVGAVVAEFFARIFFRNALNIGLPVIETPAVRDIDDGDDLEIRLLEGRLLNHTSGRECGCPPMPQKIVDLIEAGGLVPLLERRLVSQPRGRREP
ncbi:MAG: 3-isopropylmalate dehydratase [Candidatus Methylomirabilales bacterium]